MQSVSLPHHLLQNAYKKADAVKFPTCLVQYALTLVSLLSSKSDDHSS